MIPQDMLTEISRKGWDAGIKLLQECRLADTDEAHISKLMQFMVPKKHTLWADMGCGFGEAARLMKLQRPDLDFVLVNNNEFQLSKAPRNMRHVLCDMLSTPLSKASVDGCMFLYSLCHAPMKHDALAEAARITKPGGQLFVYDYVRSVGDNKLMLAKLYASAITLSTLHNVLRHTGWDAFNYVVVAGDDTIFREAYGNQNEYELIFDSLLPVMWTAVRV